ncbi:MAG TPA: right-handed parallel beta-helix repeat-containing protein [Kofleriaceae bacterium]|nr:right-handed parallel beta-helix repeat-containing protein [Kofleriaceae bacterium]
MRRLALFTTSVMALLGCTKTNDLYCDGHPGAAGCPDGGGSGVPACKNDDGCTGNAAGSVCDTAQSKCVQCTSAHDACDKAGTTPICDTTAETCGACTTDDQCGTGGFCLPSGACAAATTVIHAASTGTDPQPACGNGTPQKPCSLDDALTIAAADPTKKVIQLDDSGSYASSQPSSFVVKADVTIEAHTATFHRRTGGPGDGPIFTVTGGKAAALLGGTIDGALGINGDGIQCNSSSSLVVRGTTISNSTESAIDFQNCDVTVVAAKLQSNGNNNLSAGIKSSAGTLTIYQSVIAGNKGGGLSLNDGTVFKVVGNAIVGNGGNNSPTGGVSINATPTAAGSRLDFNTISSNQSQSIVGAGVQCAINQFTAEDNIIWNNTPKQLNGCSYAYSVIGPTKVAAENDGGNDTEADPKLAADGFHITAASSAHQHANQAADLTGIAAKDVDGDPRVKPADSGADQFRAP